MHRNKRQAVVRSSPTASRKTLIVVVFCAQVNYGDMVVERDVISNSVKLKDVENLKLQEALKVLVAGDLENSVRVFTELIEQDPENVSSWSSIGS